MDFENRYSAEINFNNLFKNVNLFEPWLVICIIFHLMITVTVLVTRHYNNFQVMFFLFLLSFVYFSENINTIAANNWKLFSERQLFDTNGFFISVFFSIPILLNCMLMIANWLYTSRNLMSQLMVAQLKNKQENEKSSRILLKKSN